MTSTSQNLLPKALAVVAASISLSASAQWTDAGSYLRTNDFVTLGTTINEAHLHIKDNFWQSKPAIFLDGFASNEGDIAWKSNSQLDIGQYDLNTSQYTQRMFIQSDGDVGFTEQLFLDNTDLGDKISLYDDRLGDDNMYGLGVESATMYFRSASRFRWYTNHLADGGASATMVLNSQGNLGIGTATPNNNYRLSVAGAIRAEEVVVETGWADFVFEDDYQLRSLPEVKNYIAEHGHLPDVPSAKEVQSEGVSLGETQTILLQKIEELTLYVIELEEKMKTLEVETQR